MKTSESNHCSTAATRLKRKAGSWLCSRAWRECKSRAPTAEFRSALFGFADDVEFHFDPPGVIQVRSASRIGYSDFGVNRKRVEAIRTRFAASGNAGS